MILEEYNEELHKKNEAEYWTGVGREEGLEKGIIMTKKIFQLSLHGATPEAIAKEMGLSVDKVQQILA